MMKIYRKKLSFIIEVAQLPGGVAIVLFKQIAEVVAVVGLAQNFAAVRALATDGIQKGHMALHAKNVAITAGATDDEVDKIVKQMIADKKINVEYAKELLKK